jgi:methionine-gamma-lyase
MNRSGEKPASPEEISTLPEGTTNPKLEQKPPWDPARAIQDGVRRAFGEYGGVNESIEPSTTFTTMRPEVMQALFRGESGPKDGCFLYARHFAPNSIHLGQRLAAMEDTEIAYPTSSGMSAITATFLQSLSPDDHIVSSGAIYGGSHALLQKLLPRFGINTTFVRPSDTKGFEEAITSKTKMIYVETEANPTMEIADLNHLAEIAHAREALLIVDNTFTPLIFTPSHQKADVILHSTTKFINGRSDAIGGAICCSHNFLMKMMDLNTGTLMLTGPVMDSRNAHQLNMYLHDLPLRIKAHSERALIFARRIESMGLSVRYPGLPSHPQHELAKSMQNADFGFGGMLSVDFRTPDRAVAFVQKLQDLGGGLNAVSLGYFDTLVSISGTTTSSEIDREEQDSIGLSPGLVRLSIGYTGNTETEWDKMQQAIEYAWGK